MTIKVIDGKIQKEMYLCYGREHENYSWNYFYL